MGSKKLKLVSLLETVDQVFRQVDEGVRRNASMKYSMRDTLNCALAMFVLKSPSLLHFEEEARADTVLGRNPRRLFRVEEVPSDETIRKRLDRVSPSKLQGIFKRLFARVQRTKLLEQYRVLEGSYVLAVDGTGVYHSNRIRCDRCCERRHSQGRISYYHEMVMGAVVHPDKHPVLFPSGPEFVANSDGWTKNDCEYHAIRRYLARFRREHPKLGTIVVMDALHANTPMVNLLRDLNLRFVLVVKETSQSTVYENFLAGVRERISDPGEEGRARHRVVEYARNLRLTKQADAVYVNMVATEEVKPTRGKDDETKISRWGFITDLEVSSETAPEIARIGRSRWQIENEVFRTLKNADGVRLERNYGHGKQYLMDVFAIAMLTAFQFDQLQELGSIEFREAKARKRGRLSHLWRSMNGKIHEVPLDSWSMMFGLIAHPERYTIAWAADPPDKM